jgi:hypothetical protein
LLFDVCFHFSYHCKPFLEVVALEIAVRERAAYAVFAEAGTPYAQLSYYVKGR